MTLKGGPEVRPSQCAQNGGPIRRTDEERKKEGWKGLWEAFKNALLTWKKAHMVLGQSPRSKP